MGKKYKLKDSVKNFFWKTSVFVLSFFMILNLLDLNAVKKIYAENVQSNIVFDASIIKEVTDSAQGVKETEVQSGEPFYIRANYTINSTGGGEENVYTGGTLMVNKPTGAVFDLEETKKLMQEHTTIFTEVTQVGDIITFSTNGDFSSGQSGNLYMRFHYPNMETVNNYGTNELFNNIRFTASMSGGSAIEPISMNSLKVINKASQKWQVAKAIVKQNNEDYSIDKGNYHILYDLKVSPEGNGDRYGRLKSEIFELVDTLPAPFTDIVSGGKAQGYPQGGGANSITIVRNEGEANAKTLVEGNEYTLTRLADGTIEKINFNESAMDTSAGNYIDAGTMVGTSFRVYAAYDYASYEIPVNEKAFSKYLLDNTLTLNYKPLGETAENVSDSAATELGWSEDNPLVTSLTIQKQVKIGTDSLISGTVSEINDFDSAMQQIFYLSENDQIAFGLFKDEAGNTPAKDKDGTSITPIAVNEKGQVAFNNLIAGTYYLKETSNITGFKESTVKKIVISKTGEITVDGKAYSNAVNVINETGEDGFGYVAFWKKGTSAASKDANTFLKDVTFKLTSKDGTKTYEATSDNNGLVLFKGVKAGEYKISEVMGADSEFDKPSNDWTVKVIGNQVNYPKKGNGAELDKDSSGKPYITNTSTKGSVRIKKVNDKNELLKGSEFMAYGPYETQEAANHADTSKGGISIDSSYTDGSTYFALTSGWYAFVETKAPVGYALDKTPQVKEIQQNVTVELTVTNKQLATLKVKKTGQLNISENFKPEVALAGAKFTVYTDEHLTKVAQDLTDGTPKDAVITTFISVDKPQSTTVMLPAGTYWIKETVTPSGYKPDNQAYEIKVEAGKTFEYSKVNEADSLGQIKITKVDASNHNTKLEGVSFQIYDSNNNIVDIVTTDKDGEATSKFLPEGNYTIKENSQPKGYSKNSANRIFTHVDVNNIAQTGSGSMSVKNNELLEIIVENEPLVTYQIKKLEGTTSLQGVKFKLYTTQADAQADLRGKEYTTGTDGSITFKDLEPGTKYFYKETKTLNDDYVLDSTIRSFTSPSKTDNYQQTGITEIKNVKYGYFKVEKRLQVIGGTDTTALKNITFSYYPKLTPDAAVDKVTADKNKTLNTGITANDGTFTSKKLIPGEYWLVEAENANYKKINPITVTVSSGTTISQTVLNIPSNGQLQMKKISSLKVEGKEVLVEGSRFYVYKYINDDVSSYQNKQVVSKFSIVDKTATAIVNLAAGEYALIEVTPNNNEMPGYTPDLKTVRKFTINAGQINKQYYENPVENTPQGRFYLDKIEIWGQGTSDKTEFRQTMPFNIYSDEACTKEVASMNSNATGVAQSPYLDAGTYWVKENLTAKQIEIYGEPIAKKVVVKAGQNHDTIYNVTGEGAGSTVDNPLKFENVPKYAKIQVTKVDQADASIKLNNAYFDTYKEVPQNTKGAIKQDFNGTIVYLLKVNTASAITGTADTNGDNKADKGEAFTEIFEPGTYYLKETKAPSGYKWEDAWTGPIVLIANQISKVTIENYKPSQVIGEKVNQDKQLIKKAGIKVALFESEDDAKKVAATLKTGGDAATKLLSDLARESNWATHGIKQIAKTDKNGRFAFTQLNVTKTYYVVEIETLKDYVRDENVHTVTVKKVDNSYVLYENENKFQLVNIEQGHIKVKKIVTLSGNELTLDGVSFDIYKAANTDQSDMTTQEKVGTYVSGTYSSGANGTFLTGGLEPGWYIIQETKVPEGIVMPSDNKWKVEVKAGETNEIYFTSPIENEANYGSFYLTKVSAQDTSKKLNASFELWYYNTGKSAYEKTETVVNVKKDSVYQSKLLPTGKYQLRETSVEAGYTVNPNPIGFVIEKGKITGMNGDTIVALDAYKNNPIVVKNEQKGSISIKKTGTMLDSSSPVALVGIEFTLYKNVNGNADEDTVEANRVAVATSDSKGIIKFTGIDHGGYWLKETKVNDANAQNGYIAGKVVQVNVEPGKETTNIVGGTDFTNDSTYGQIKIIKGDYFDQNKKLKGAEFEIYNNRDASGTPIQKIVTGVDGTAYSKMLKPGEYYIKEVKTPSGYLADDTVYGPYKVVAHTLTDKMTDGTVVIKNKAEQSIKIVKNDSKTNSLIDEKYMETASFALYATEADANNKTNELQKVGKEQSFTFTGLQPDTTYYIRELKAPNGYTLSDTVTEVKTGITSAPTNIKEIILVNDPKGSIRIEKIAQWELGDTTGTTKFSLSDVTFILLKGENELQRQNTDKNGIVEFLNLDAGDYTVKEVTPTGYVENKKTYILTVTAGEKNTELTGNQAILNEPNQGKFTFKKTAPDGTDIDGVEKATFALYKENKVVTGYDGFHTETDGTFTSGVLEPGTYELREITAPDGFTLMNPISFKVEAKKIITVHSESEKTVVNEALGNVEITKYSDSYKYDVTATDQPMSGVEFTLENTNYSYSNKQTTDANGKIIWKDLKPGTYTLKEITLEGYESIKGMQVIVKAGEKSVQTYYPEGTTNGKIYNISNQGRLVIYKEDDSTKAPLDGAQFNIYKLTDKETPVNKKPLITDKQGYAYSDLLDATEAGTTYIVKEVKAPDGYTLDEAYHSLTQEVVVKPLQDISIIKNNKSKNDETSNWVTFQNRKKNHYEDFGLTINKTIQQSDGSYTGVEISSSQTKALLTNEQKLNFRIDGYAIGDNKIDAEKVTVTDTDIKLIYKDNGQDVEETADDKQHYFINKITVHRAYEGGKAEESGEVSATLQYQTVGNDTWKDYSDKDALSNLQKVGNEGITLDVSQLNAVHFRVVYTGTKKNFHAEGINFEATFKARKEITDKTTHEIVKITNKAKSTYTFNVKNEEGKSIPTDYERETPKVTANFPLLDTVAPKANINIRTDNGTTFIPGDVVYYTITVENKSSGSNVSDLEKPIVSFDLPVGMSLVDDYKDFGNTLMILYGQEDSAEIIEAEVQRSNANIITASDKNIVQIIDNVPAKVVNNAGELVEDPNSKTTKVVVKLGDVSVDTSNKLYIKFAGQISQSPQATGLFAPSYLNSLATYPVSAENPYGNSVVFDTTSNADVVEDTTLDKLVNKDVGGKKYAYSGADVTVRINNNLNVYKQVKGQYDTDYLDTANTGSTAPKGSIDYNVYLQNGKSDQKIQKARIVDILPFYGDTMVARTNASGTTTDRGTQLLKRPVLKSVELTDFDGNAIQHPYTIYYCVSARTNDQQLTAEWTAANRNSIPREQELPMMYGTWDSSAWTDNKFHTWTTVQPADMSTVTAVGVEVDTSKNPLDQYQGFRLHISMTAPDYATDEFDEMNGKLIKNSAMGAVQRYGTAMGNMNIDISDTVENDPVKVALTLAKGSLGDYAFFDRNKNGIQDDGDVPVTGLNVILHTFKTERVNGEIVKKEITDRMAVTQTDLTGHYSFTGLDCNEMLDKNGDADDPDNYLGGAIYSYKVEFATPLDESKYAYVPTTREAGSDRAVDSNIEAVTLDDGTQTNMSDEVRLTTIRGVDSSITGEHNPTIDAGFKALGGLGDFVWLDKNRNGIQDVNEPGVSNVTVKLYTADAEGNVKALVGTTKTDFEGKYLFTGLKDDRYIVEFDISNTDSYGYTPYTFTKPYVMADAASEDDSNAREYKGSKTIARTDVITLADRQIDLSIDAGLVYHSALSGYAFEDKNYNDIQDIGVALPQTYVELYRIGENGTRANKPVQTATVGADGKYFFDNLVEGFYQVHFVFPKGFEAVKDHVGNDEIDSDVSEELDEDKNSGYTPVFYIAPNSLEEHWDAGAVRYGSIGDYVWEDLNKDGIQDSGETPIANVPVYLQTRIAGEDSWNFYAATTTNQHGRYVFERLKGSEYTNIEYRVVFDLPFTTKLTTPLQGSDFTVDSNALANYINGWGFPTNVIHLGYGQNDMTWDAGIIQTSGSVGDYVWFDENRNGIQDEENTGISGIKVVLERNDTVDIAETGWIEVGTTTTNQAGYYRFDDLSEGYYRVKFYLDGYDVTEALAGEDPAWDSDGLTPDGNWYITRPFYLDEGGFDMTWDCGVVQADPNNPNIPNGNSGTVHPVISETKNGVIVGVNTGDHTTKNIWMIILSGSALSALLLWKRRKKIESKKS